MVGTSHAKAARLPSNLRVVSLIPRRIARQMVRVCEKSQREVSRECRQLARRNGGDAGEQAVRADGGKSEQSGDGDFNAQLRLLIGAEVHSLQAWLNQPAADARFSGGADLIIDARLLEHLRY